MELFLMRHGIAASPQFYDGSDRQRPLTEEGTQQHEEVIRILAPLLQPLDHLLTSPYIRARQTANITAAAVTCANPVEETDLLADDCTLGNVIHLLKQYPPGRVGQKGVVTKSVTNQEIERNAGVEQPFEK